MTNTSIFSATPVTGSALIRRAEELRHLIREQAAEIEAAGRLTPEVHAALIDSGIYRMTVPAEFGAPDVTLPECMRVLEALAVADGSTAWSVWAGLGGPAMAAFMTAEGARELLSAADTTFVGSVAAMGTARAVDGGYEVTGRWPFASGIRQAKFSGGICAVFEGETQLTTPDGEPIVIIPAWPAEACEVFDTWDTTGLRGTGSNDIAVQQLFVPDYMVIDFRREPRPGLSPLHYIHVDNAANVTVAAIALGIAEAALEDFMALAPVKRVHGGGFLAQSPLAKLALAEGETRLAQARGHLYETAETMAELMAEGVYPGEEWLARTSLASVATVDAALEVVTSLYRAAGTSAIFRSRLLDRCLRDIFTLQAHKTVQHLNNLIYGGAELMAA